MRILIVEDDPVSRMFLKYVLAAIGVCDLAVDGAEAVRAFRRAHDSTVPYSLVCLDITMPDMDGREVLRSMRAQEKARGIAEVDGVKVVITSALDDRDKVREAVSAGASHLLKPVHKEDLLQALRTIGLIV